MIRSVQHQPIWDSTGKQTDPTAAGAALADSGNLGPGQYEARVTLSASANAEFSVEHRNVADDGNMNDPAVVYVGGGSSGQYVFEFTVNTSGESFRVKMNANLTGTAAAHISVRRVGRWCRQHAL